MRSDVCSTLVEPGTLAPLRLEVRHAADSEIIDGVLHGPEARSYAIHNGIPRFVQSSDDAAQEQTSASFGFKWQRESSYGSESMKAGVRGWILSRYGFDDIASMRRYFAGKRRILDAGCGAGFSSSLWMDRSWRSGLETEWMGADISPAVDVARRRLGAFEGTSFVQADLMALPFAEGTFDAVFSEGVLHHTPSTFEALRAVTRVLEPGGEFLFYVYRKKGPVREFTDDHIRDWLSQLPPDEGWEALRPLTHLGRALAELHAEIDLAEDIPVLGIPAGRHDVQRLFYWYVAKVFWNQELSFEENHHANFDWYAPRYAHRQTEDDIRRWCADVGLSIVHFDRQESGFTVRAVKE